MSKSEGKGSTISPLPFLTAFIASEHQRDGWISFPQGTEIAIKTYQSLNTKFSKWEIQQLVQALSGHDYPFCSQLDELSLLILCSIVTYSESCGARYRGFYLIAEAVHPNIHDSQTFITHKYAKKSCLHSSLPHLLQSITHGTEQEEPRCWMSVLVLELLEGCPENVEFLRGFEGTEWPALTKVMKHCKCEILRFLVGSIIRQMLAGGVKRDTLWLAEDAKAWANRFPFTPQQDHRWMGYFGNLMKDMFNQGLLPGRNSYVDFAGEISVGKHRYMVNVNSEILVTVTSSLLRCWVKASPHDLPTQIDIPLSNITSHKITSATPKQVADLMYTTELCLSYSADAPLFINADERNEREVEISFYSHGAADNLLRIIRVNRANKATAENAAKKAQDSAKTASNARKRDTRKVLEDTEDERSQATILARPSLDDHDHVAEGQGNPSGSAQLMTHDDGFADAKTIAANATSLLVSNEQASALAQQRVPKIIQRASQGHKRQSTEGLPVEDNTIQRIPNPNETQTQSSKRRKLTQQLQDDQGEVRNSGESKGESKPRNAHSKLMVSKPINSSQSRKSKAKMPSKKQRAASRDLADKRNEQSKTNDITGPIEDPYDMPASPVPPKRTLVNRTGEPSRGKVYKRTEKSTVANGTDAQTNHLKERITQAPQPLAQPKSRRAAAIHANERIQGIDNSPHPSVVESRQTNAKSKQAIHGPSNIAKENVNTASRHDSIETVQTADKIRSSPTVLVQDSIETVNDMNGSLSTKQIVHNPAGNGDLVKHKRNSRDIKVGAMGIERGPQLQHQAHKAPKVADDAHTMVLDPGVGVSDSFQEKLPRKIQFDSLRPPTVPEATQQEVQGGWVQDFSQRQEKEDANLAVPSIDGQYTRTARRKGEMYDALPFNETSTKDNGGSSILTQSGTDRGAKAALNDVEDQLALEVPEHAQTDKNDISTPTIAKHLKAHGLSATGDPFSAKLNEVVKNVVITEERHPTSTVDASRSKDKYDTIQETARKSLRQSMLQEGQRNIGTSDSKSPNPHTIHSITGLKRKSEGELRDFPRKVRKHIEQPNGTTDMSANKTPHIATRKTAIISFSTSGPRNQGTASKKKDKKYRTLANGARMMELPGAPKKTAEPSEVSYVAPIPLKKPQQPILQKADASIAEAGYIAMDDEEHIDFENEDQGPPTILQNRYSQQGKFDGLDTKPSSQTTRVNYNGSPMPVRHPTNEPAVVSNTTSKSKITYQNGHSEQDMRSDEESFAGDIEDDDPYDDEDKDEGLEHENTLVPMLPSRNPVSQSSMPQPGAYNWTNIAKNSKQVPSSPHEPSATAALPPHHIQDGGRLINASTSVPVIPSPPQDPFVAEAAKSSSFMRLLQDASESKLKKRPEAAVSERTKRVRITTVQSPNDPDKTLVESSFSRRRMTSDRSKRGTSSSSSGDTSEEVISQTLIQEAEDTPAKWNKALLPHQENTMDVLNEITHRLLAHMVKGEDALLDLVQDFKNSGTKMINQIEKELQQGMVAQAAATAALEKKVTDLFQLTARDLKASEGQVLGRATQIEIDLNANQLSLMASIEAALALSRN